MTTDTDMSLSVVDEGVSSSAAQQFRFAASVLYDLK